MTYNFITDILPEHITCTCGTKGSHEDTEMCLKEGIVVFDPGVTDAFDPTIVTYRYDDDPVAMALIATIEDLIWTARAQNMLIWFNRRERDRIDKQYEDTVKKMKSEQDHLDGDIRSLKAGLAASEGEVHTLRRAQERYKMLLEEMARATGQFVDKALLETPVQRVVKQYLTPPEEYLSPEHVMGKDLGMFDADKTWTFDPGNDDWLRAAVGSYAEPRTTKKK